MLRIALTKKTNLLWRAIILLLAGSLACNKGGDPQPGPGPGPDPNPDPVEHVIVITGVSPETADAGPVTITGTGFHTNTINNEVKFGDLTATVKTASATQLVVDLPAGLAGGTHTISVKAFEKTATRTNGFHFLEWVVSTLAGTGGSGTMDGAGNQATFTIPTGMTADLTGNLYVADGNRIRKITPEGIVSTYAGRGTRGKADGDAGEATFDFPRSLTADDRGNLYVADQGNHLIRKISAAGIVSTVAGTGSAGHDNGIGTAASFNMPYSVFVNGPGTILYVGDYANHVIRKIDLPTGEVSDFAGTGGLTSSDGKRLQAGIPWPGGICQDLDGNLYITEKGAGRLRKINTMSEVTTIESNLDVNTQPTQLVADEQRNTYVVFTGRNLVKKYTAAGVGTIAFGQEFTGDENGSARKAKFLFPEGIALVKGADGKPVFYICDTGNRKIKKIVQLTPSVTRKISPLPVNFPQD